jgi:hypothetical protein
VCKITIEIGAAGLSLAESNFEEENPSVGMAKSSKAQMKSMAARLCIVLKQNVKW